MTYALIENGVVENMIWLYEGNAADFPNAVPVGDCPVRMGDTWDGTDFYRNGKKVQTGGEEAAEMREALALLGVTMNE